MRLSPVAEKLITSIETTVGLRTTSLTLSIYLALLARELSRQNLAAKPYMPLLETLIEDYKEDYRKMQRAMLLANKNSLN
jgi:hypothetical protein